MTYIIQELFSLTVALLAVEQTALVIMYFLFYESLFYISLVRQQSRYPNQGVFNELHTIQHL
jgi:hypothetical protein